MKCIKTMVEPTPELSNYLEEATTPEYNEFRDYRGGAAYRELIAELVNLQRGLCGYCEIEINLNQSNHQVEHVVPRSAHPEAALHASNLIACCKGGTVESKDKERFLKPPKRNLSCGQAKAERDDPQFLDPRLLPALPSLLVVRNDGRIEADSDACQSEEEVARVEKTIEILGLNVERLRAARERRWRDLLDVWAGYFQSDDVMTQGAQSALLPGRDGRLARFFTTRRSFFGRYGEHVLSLAPDSWI